MERLYITSEEIIIDFSKFDNFDEVVDEMYWKDLYFEEYNGVNIHNANTDEYYEIERKFHYADFNGLVDDKEKIVFDRILDDDIVQEIKEWSDY